LPALLDCLGGLGIRRLMVEGGARVISAFLSQGLADVLVLTVAPLLIGGLPVLEMPLVLSNPERIESARLREVEYKRLGDDLIVMGLLPSR
jgi:riboflavin biosynthesis pyrimidine reductase